MRVASEQPREIVSLSAHGVVSARSCYSRQNSVGGEGRLADFLDLLTHLWITLLEIFMVVLEWLKL